MLNKSKRKLQKRVNLVLRFVRLPRVGILGTKIYSNLKLYILILITSQRFGLFTDAHEIHDR